MDKTEFKVKLNEFLDGMPDRDRPESLWFNFLESWAARQYNKAYNKEHSKETEG